MAKPGSRRRVAALTAAVAALAVSAAACTGPPLEVAPAPTATIALSRDVTATTLLPPQQSAERPAAVLVTVPVDGAEPRGEAPTATTASARLGAAAVPHPEGVVLAGDGLGLVSFGAGVPAALDVLTDALGQPVADSGWIDTFSIYGDCPGSRLRVVEWPGVLAMFGDPEDGYQHRDADDEHFMTWRLGTFGPDPYMLRTAEGIGVGATRAEIAEAYAAATFRPATATEALTVLLATRGGRLVGIFDRSEVLRSLEAGTACATR